MADELLDVRGLNCPMPVLKAQKALRSMAAGAVLEVLATDPGSVEDFEALCRVGKHELVAQTQSGGEFRFLIRRSG